MSRLTLTPLMLRVVTIAVRRDGSVADVTAATQRTPMVVLAGEGENAVVSDQLISAVTRFRLLLKNWSQPLV